MRKKHVVQLTADDREQCRERIRCGTAPARSIMHAQVLLKADASPEAPGWTDAAIAEAFGVCKLTVANIRKALVTAGLPAALNHYRLVNRQYQPKLDGRGEAHLIALACSAPPEGHTRPARPPCDLRRRRSHGAGCRSVGCAKAAVRFF